MKNERWEQIEQIYLAALKRARDERGAFLATACAGDELLRREVESLLACETEAEDFIEQPAIEVAAGLLAETQTGVAAGQTLGHYRVISRLGAGGMGEVYLALDLRLGRRVALKLLPERFVSDADRVRRFEQEARAASALSHPNIITIFEIGQIKETHFIATEFVDGQTLRQREGRWKLLDALDAISQTASALAAAHEAGIVHRDIKPENLMLRRDGLLKVLDFGLARVTERPVSTIDSQLPTFSRVETTPGTVMGTITYMSPEQARGLEVDARTDIFSLGVVLYEMIAGSPPFAGATTADVLAAILHVEPAPLRQRAPGVPEMLEGIVSRALRKNREERYQTAGELLDDLKGLRHRLEIQAELARAVQPTEMVEAVTTGGGSSALPAGQPAANTGGMIPARTTSSAEYLIGEIRRHKTGVTLAALALVAIVVALGFGLYRLISRRPPAAPFQTMRLARITASGKAAEAAISPDGRYVAYVMDDEGRQSLWLRQTAASSAVQLSQPAEGQYYRSLVFSRDGNYLCYLKGGRGARMTLHRMPILGGPEQKLIEDISNQDAGSNFSFSPDGKRVAFIRLDAHFDRAMVVMNLDGSGERQLTTRKIPRFLAGTAWSPDGKMIACIEGDFGPGNPKALLAVRVEDGKAEPLSSQRWARIAALTWLADGSGLVISAAGRDGAGQLWMVSYPGGEARRVTNDLNSYSGVSLTADGSAVATVQQDRSQYLWLLPNGDTQRARKITAEAGNYDDIHWTPDGRILYSSVESGNPDLWIINADGTGKKQLTVNPGIDVAPSVSPDGRYIYFSSNRTAQDDGPERENLWRMESDGSNPKLLFDREAYFPDCSPDGRWIVFYSDHQNGPFLWKLPTEGGEPVRLTHKDGVARPVISPDGRWIAGNYLIREANTQIRIAIFPFAGGEPVKTFDIFGYAIRELRWTPDSRAITYLDARNGVVNIWAQPIDGGPPKQLTDFRSDYIFSWNWSRDGKQLVCSRGARASDVVVISDFR